MVQLVGFSGAHGTGKSSVIDRIKEKNVPEIFVDEYKISRSVLSSMGLTLEQATSTVDRTKEYQLNVLDAARERIRLIVEEHQFGGTMVVDRTVADIAAYTRIWCEQNRIEKKWYWSYASECASLLENYGEIFVFPTGVFGFEDDGVRAKEDTQLLHEKYLLEFLNVHGFKYYVVQEKTVQKRAEEIIDILKG